MSLPTTNTVEQVQKDIYAVLTNAPYFQDIGVFLMRPRSEGGMTIVQSEIDKRLAGLVDRGSKSGAAVIVQMPLIDAQDPNVPGPRLKFTFTIRVVEFPMMNMDELKGSLKPAEEIVLEVLSMFHQWMPNVSMTLVASSPAAIPSDEDPRKVIYDVRFEQQTGLEKRARVAKPVMSFGSSAFPFPVALTCATPGASIFFSTDGNYPFEAYTAPVVLTEATRLRAIGRLAGSLDSNIAEMIFT